MLSKAIRRCKPVCEWVFVCPRERKIMCSIIYIRETVWGFTPQHLALQGLRGIRTNSLQHHWSWWRRQFKVALIFLYSSVYERGVKYKDMLQYIEYIGCIGKRESRGISSMSFITTSTEQTNFTNLWIKFPKMSVNFLFNLFYLCLSW